MSESDPFQYHCGERPEHASVAVRPAMKAKSVDASPVSFTGEASDAAGTNPVRAGFWSRTRHVLDERHVRERPVWQRILYPFLGAVTFTFGIFAAIMPILPGGMLIPIGLVFIMCFHQRTERWSKRTVTAVMNGCERQWKRLVAGFRDR